MTNEFLLVRHATCERMDEMLLGRTVDAPLDARGMQQAAAMARALHQLQAEYPGRLIVVVTHAEVIRAIVLHWLEASVDGYYRLVISPASWTRVSIGDWGVRIDGINQQALT